MSTAPKSLDLRLTVINFLQEGHTTIIAAKIFNLHVNTIRRWASRFRKTGSVAPKKMLGSKSRIDIKEFEEFVTKNPELNLEQISKVFNLSISGVHYYMKKIDFVYKKKLFAWKNKIN